MNNNTPIDPQHYNNSPSGLNTIEVIEEMPFNLGAAMKHIYRSGTKEGEPALRDFKKAEWYLNREIKCRHVYTMHPADLNKFRRIIRNENNQSKQDMLIMIFETCHYNNVDYLKPLRAAVQAAIKNIESGNSGTDNKKCNI